MLAAPLERPEFPASQNGFSKSDIVIHDDVLSKRDQDEVYDFLNAPGWAFGAYSDPAPNAPRYWYKHFAGYVRDGREAIDAAQFATNLGLAAPPVAKMWATLSSTILSGHKLTRCYANGYPSGCEGGLHQDSMIATHFTCIYYPHAEWHPNFAGETVFFTQDGSDILASIYPKPNRLIVFPGAIPHVARGISRTCPKLRITLMFKTMT